jgi:hypothetical protein
MKKHIFILFLILPFISFSQTPKPKVKSVIGTCCEYGDTIKKCTEEYYNRAGLLDSFRDNRYYTVINNSYDKKGRITQKEVLYGESNGNGITKYLYYRDSTVEQEVAGGYSRETITQFAANGDTTSVSVIFVRYGDAIEKSKAEYIYMDKKLKEIKNTRISYIIPYQLYEMPFENRDTVKKILKTLDIFEKKEFSIKYEYNKSGKIVSKIEETTDAPSKTSYFYDKKEKYLTKIIIENGNDTTQISEYLYDKKGNQTQQQVRSFSKSENTRYVNQINSDYDRNSNLQYKTMSNNGMIYQVDYYQNGNLIKTEEADNNGQIYSTIFYKYEYY